MRVMKNTLSTILIGLALAALTVLAGWQLLGSWALIALVGFFGILGLSAARTRPHLVLRGARELRYFEAPALFDAVDRLARRAGIDREIPLYYARNRAINAAAMDLGDRVAIVVTDGILGSLSERELEGVLAHEIAHIRNRDLSMFRIATALRHATRLFARSGVFLLIFALPVLIATGTLGGGGLLFLFIAPFLSWLLQLALMRTREFAADATAAELTRDPHGLAQALERIDAIQRNAVPWMLQRVQDDDMSSLLRTHPSTSERVARLHDHDRRLHQPGTISFT